MSEKKIRRPGAGRTKGSNSFVKMKVKAVLDRFGAMPDLELMLSRKQMEAFGINNLVTGKASELKNSITGQSVETAPEVKMTEF